MYSKNQDPKEHFRWYKDKHGQVVFNNSSTVYLWKIWNNFTEKSLFPLSLAKLLLNDKEFSFFGDRDWFYLFSVRYVYFFKRKRGKLILFRNVKLTCEMFPVQPFIYSRIHSDHVFLMDYSNLYIKE